MFWYYKFILKDIVKEVRCDVRISRTFCVLKQTSRLRRIASRCRVKIKREKEQMFVFLCTFENVCGILYDNTDIYCSNSDSKISNHCIGWEGICKNKNYH